MQNALRRDRLDGSVSFEIFTDRTNGSADAARPVVLIFNLYMMLGAGDLVHNIWMLLRVRKTV